MVQVLHGYWRWLLAVAFLTGEGVLASSFVESASSSSSLVNGSVDVEVGVGRSGASVGVNATVAGGGSCVVFVLGGDGGGLVEHERKGARRVGTSKRGQVRAESGKTSHVVHTHSHTHTPTHSDTTHMHTHIDTHTPHTPH